MKSVIIKEKCVTSISNQDRRNPPFCLKHQKIYIHMFERWFARCWVTGNKGKWSLGDGTQVNPTTAPVIGLKEFLEGNAQGPGETKATRIPRRREPHRQSTSEVCTGFLLGQSPDGRVLKISSTWGQGKSHRKAWEGTVSASPLMFTHEIKKTWTPTKNCTEMFMEALCVNSQKLEATKNNTKM